MSSLYATIHRRKRLFQIGAAVFGGAFLIELVAARGTGSLNLEKWQLALLLLPPSLFVLSWMLLWYLSWCAPRAPSLPSSLKRGFYWLAAATMVLIVGAIYGTFVFT
jgi:hypothetical protein